MPDNGPFETVDAARMTPAARAIYDTMRASHERGAADAMCTALIVSACDAAGVELGAYDERILAWMGNWEPQTCQVIAGLITRASEAARHPEPGTVTEWAVRHESPDGGVERVTEHGTDEHMARLHAGATRKLGRGWKATLRTRHITPWKDVPDA
jgi:hypothetical protein